MIEILDTLLGTPVFIDPFMQDLFTMVEYVLGAVLVVTLIMQILFFFYYLVKPIKGGR